MTQKGAKRDTEQVSLGRTLQNTGAVIKKGPVYKPAAILSPEVVVVVTWASTDDIKTQADSCGIR